MKEIVVQRSFTVGIFRFVFAGNHWYIHNPTPAFGSKFF